jgi:hypothetical protein
LIAPPPEPESIEPDSNGNQRLANQFTQPGLETNHLAPDPDPKPTPRRNRRRPSPQTTSVAKAENPAVLPREDRHRRKCGVCRHPERALIEEDFLMWRSTWAIIKAYNISDDALHRHAHAIGLFPVRRESLRLALDRIIARGAETDVSGDTIIRAIRAQACLTDDNRWVEPARRIIYANEPTLIAGSRIRNHTDVVENKEPAQV